MGNGGSHIKWPPAVESIEILGEVKESSGHTPHRDNGHSISLRGERYYVFGDTFCIDERDAFVGVTNNAIARIPDPLRPQLSEFCDDRAKVSEFIPYTASEKEFTEAPKNKKELRRVVNWNFSEVIEDSPGSGTGWIFFDKVQTHGAEIEYEFGTDVARITVSDNGDIHVRRFSDEMLFGPEEPRFGSISTLVDDDGFVYLLGGKGFSTCMARVKHGSNPRQRENYQFLTHGGWKNNYSNVRELKDVLGDQMHGAFVKLSGDKFAPRGKPYMWFGVNKWLDNKMWVGCAEKIEGPWDLRFVGEAPGLLGDRSGVRYCLYPHPWYGDQEKGEMLLSWTDNGVLGGIVGLALLRFKMEAGNAQTRKF